MTGVAAPATLEPRSLPRLFDAIIGIERRHAWDLFVLGMLFHLPVHLFRIAGRFAGARSAISRLSPEAYSGALWWDIWNSLAITAGVIATCQLYEKGNTSVQDVLRGFRSGGWRLLGTVSACILLAYAFDATFPTNVGPFLPYVFVVLSTILAWTAPALPAATVEKAAPWTAIARALSLVRSNFWRVALTVWIVWTITNLADSTSVNAVYKMTDNSTLSGVADLAVDGFLYPLRGIALAVLYFDCRVRREAYDLEAMLSAVRP